MQTFAPHQDIHCIAMILDNQRLGKQRVEAYQLVYNELGFTTGKAWRNHPAAVMWRGHTQALIRYGMAMCEEWKRRGYVDTLHDKFDKCLTEGSAIMPWWWGHRKMTRNHRQRLLLKNFTHYRQFWKYTRTTDYRNIWPTDQPGEWRIIPPH